MAPADNPASRPAMTMRTAVHSASTFAISVGGVFVGHIFGARYKNRAEFVGGAILLLIGVKILLEHFGVL